MAKELPYFKFEPNQWENGNIQMCSREDKGLFIDICTMYWSRLGELPEKLVIQKLCGGNANALQTLCDENIIAIIDGMIYIKFLSQQLEEFENKSIRNAIIAKEGWEKRRKDKSLSESDANALQTQSERNAIRGEESREDEIKESKKFIFKKSLIDYGFDKNLVEDWLKVRKTKKASNTETAFNVFISEIEKRECDINKILQHIVVKNWIGFKWEWYDKQNNESSVSNDFINLNYDDLLKYLRVEIIKQELFNKIKGEIPQSMMGYYETHCKNVASFIKKNIDLVKNRTLPEIVAMEKSKKQGSL